MRRKWILNKPVKGIKLNPGHPLARGLVGCWLFNEGSGNKVFDLSGNGNTGTLIADTHFVPGKFGLTLDFDGNGDYVDCGSNSSIDNIFSGGGTLSIWINADSKGESNYPRILDKRIEGGDFAGWTFYLGDDGVAQDKIIAFDHSTDGVSSGQWGTPANSISHGTWYHLVVVFNKDSINNVPLIYINGVNQTLTELNDPDGNFLSDAAHSLDIGRRKDDARDFDGRIDIPMLYNRALSASEIALLYREPFCMFERQEIVFLAVAVGPANLLSVNAVTTANIKSINAVLIGSVKSINAIA